MNCKCYKEFLPRMVIKVKDVIKMECAKCGLKINIIYKEELNDQKRHDPQDHQFIKYETE